MLCRIQHLSKGYGPSQAYNTDLWADPRLLGTATDLDLVKGFLCVFVCFTCLGPVCLVFLVYFLLFVLSCQYQCKWLPVKTRLWNDLLCVERDVKLDSLIYLLTGGRPRRGPGIPGEVPWSRKLFVHLHTKEMPKVKGSNEARPCQRQSGPPSPYTPGFFRVQCCVPLLRS